MQILDASKNNNQFDGVTVKGSLPELFHGMDFAYFIQDDRFCKAEPDFMEKAKPLSDLSRNGQFHFQMGRNTLSNFYHNVLPQLQDIADITEENPEKFRQYLTPEAHFVFYLDMEDDNITCKISSFYGQKEYSLCKAFFDNSIRTEQQFRDFPLENSVLGQAMEWLPYYDADFDVLHCAGEEDLVYHMMESGTDALMELGEVRCTNRFRSKHTLKTVKVSVGVSLSGGLLDLNISTDDISSQELLDVLKSYQQKKKYYKLKSGVFEGIANGYPIGEYKNRRNIVSDITTALPEDVHARMTTLLDEYNAADKHDLHGLAKFHADYEAIHPFQDGNGRTGRLILFKECLKNDIIPFVVNDSRKAEYYHALNIAQTKQDYSLLERFFREEQTEYCQQVEGFLPPVKE